MSVRLIASLLISFLILLNPTNSFSQKKKKKKGTPQTVKASPSKPKSKNGIKPYKTVITKKAKTDAGLFKVHKVDDNFYYEIPDSLLEKEMLLVSRIAALPANFGGGFMNAGSKTGEQVVRWMKRDKKIYLRSVSYNAVADEDLPIYKSVKANNYEPIIYTFKIEAISPDSSGVVIKVNNLFTKDIKAISPLSSRIRKQYQVRRLDESKGFIESVKSFPMNIEVKHDLSFSAEQPPSSTQTGSISVQMNQSMILLPAVPMKPRFYDRRVGWFSLSTIDYGSDALKADAKRYIRRWKLEPKDPAAYERGELVEPIKPIVYYLDPATPEIWRPYFKKGIEDWQKAFETAGFKNAIIAKDPPTKEEDPDFSPEDVRYSVVRYVASTTRNAVGPSVSDPRSGEIIESDIIWYHNHLRSYRNRYLLETGAANPSARTLNTPENQIGEMMRMVIAHEVGHALGLPHNMKASAAYPVDSLRSGTFTQEYGIATTIMDYARYNYVAQPGDKDIRFIRQLGPYDHYAINWGYRYLANTSSPEDEKSVLNSWIKEKEGDPKYLFGGRGNFDPTSQTEGIGDDNVKASSYGLDNLKIVSKNLIDWTTTNGEGYDDLRELYGELVGVWSRYVGHVVTNIGGVHETLKTADQEGVVYTAVPRVIQKQSMRFLVDNAFNTPDWLINKDILQRIEHTGTIQRVRSLQARHLNNVLDVSRLQRLIEEESFNKNSYTAIEMMNDLRKGIWKELSQGRTIDAYRRNLQRAYMDRMEALMQSNKNQRSSSSRFTRRPTIDPSQSDIKPLVRAQLSQLKAEIKRANYRISDKMSTYHLDDILTRIDQALNPDK